MNLTEILQEAIENPENWFQDGPFRGGVNWNLIDSHLWCHPDSVNYTQKEKFDALEAMDDPRPDITDKWRDHVNMSYPISEVADELKPVTHNLK